jgi:predicted RNA binding protein YcfA (HicA-like mRNA interferase family)
VNSEEIIRMLEKAGFERKGGKGSHHRYVHSETNRMVSIVHPQRDVGIGLVKAYERQSGVKLRSR